MDSINRVTRTTDLPSKFDWRDEGVVGPVQDQDVCGACWAFTTIGIVESMYAIKTGILHSLSVQEVGYYYISNMLFRIQIREPLEKTSYLTQNTNFVQEILQIK